MRYISTRGAAPALAFDEVLLAGLARDGGLYVPEAWPTLSAATIAGLAGKSYPQVVAEVTYPFVEGVDRARRLRAHRRAKPMPASITQPSRR